MKYNLSFVGILFLIIFSGCRPEPLVIELPPYEQQIVVFSQVIPSQFMTVALTKTLDGLEFSEENGDSLTQGLLSDLFEEEAKVSISYRDVTDTLFEVGSGIYASLTTPQFQEETYDLKVETKDGKVLTASSKMLSQVTFNEVLPEIEKSDSDTLVKINFSLDDIPGDNWYMMNFYTRGGQDPIGLDLNSFFPTGSNVRVQTELFSDDAFDGNTFTGTVELPQVLATDSLVVTVSNINESYYRYLEIRQASNNFFTELTKEPVSLPTNIEGGLGFFNTHVPDLRFFDLNEF